MTEWDSLKELDFESLATLVKNKLVLDCRGICNPATLRRLGFNYCAVGRPPTLLEPESPQDAIDGAKR